MITGLNASRAAKAYLDTKGLALTVYSAIADPDSDDGNTPNNRVIPCVICFASNVSEYPLGTGNSSLNLHFRLIASADDLTAGEFVSIYDLVFSAISTDSICEDLSSAAAEAGIAFTAFGFTSEPQQTDPRTEGRNRDIEMILPINCCPSIVS